MSQQNSSGYKAHHYVPVTYQNRWSFKEDRDKDKKRILVYLKNTGQVIPDITKNQAQKKNLYDMDFMEGLENVKGFEKIILNHFEGSYSSVMEKTLDKNELPTSNNDIKVLANFILLQGIRSLSAMEDAKYRHEYIKEIDKEYKQKTIESPFMNDMAAVMAATLLRDLPKTINHANLTIIIPPKGQRFITSDNPSSVWFKEGENFYPMKYSNPDFRIYDRYFLCPLSPHFCGMIKLSNIINNGMIDNDGKFQKDKNLPYEFQNVDKENFNAINSMIYDSSNKIIFLAEKEDIKHIRIAKFRKINTSTQRKINPYFRG